MIAMDLLDCVLNPNFISSDSCSSTSNNPLQDNYLLALTDSAIVQQVTYFHQSIPGYRKTPLIKLNQLSQNLGIDQIMVKDESQRFDLNAFKMLGASFAIAEILAHKLNLKPPYSFQAIVKQSARYRNLELVTTTDGNHGRAVAWCAKQFGCVARVYMPNNSEFVRLEAIKQYTPYAEITDLDYDDTVEMVARLAHKNKWQLVQDTAWDNYTEIPDNIMRGYFTLIKEFDQQAPQEWPSHVFLQAGVGSMAAAITAYFVAHNNPTPIIVLVEPNNAPCFYESIKINDGLPHQVGDLRTIMAGLACGKPSKTAWQILSRYCFGFIKCDDALTIKGIKRYANPTGSDTKVISGESAAVTLGVLEMILSDKNYDAAKNKLKFNSQSKVLLISTEGDTDPINYASALAS